MATKGVGKRESGRGRFRHEGGGEIAIWLMFGSAQVLGRGLREGASDKNSWDCRAALEFPTIRTSLSMHYRLMSDTIRSQTLADFGARAYRETARSRV
jgi:hypothetical protein